MLGFGALDAVLLRLSVGPKMNDPWLEVPLADYEEHMALPDIGQAQMPSAE